MRSKNYVVITFRSFVKITAKNRFRFTSESHFGLTLERYVVKPCKWNQKCYVVIPFRS